MLEKRLMYMTFRPKFELKLQLKKYCWNDRPIVNRGFSMANRVRVTVRQPIELEWCFEQILSWSNFPPKPRNWMSFLRSIKLEWCLNQSSKWSYSFHYTFCWSDASNNYFLVFSALSSLSEVSTNRFGVTRRWIIELKWRFNGLCVWATFHPKLRVRAKFQPKIELEWLFDQTSSWNYASTKPRIEDIHSSWSDFSMGNRVGSMLWINIELKWLLDSKPSWSHASTKPPAGVNLRLKLEFE